jgi:5'-3' exonuclease
MGKELSEDEKNKKSWDSNAITPGTPFMELLAISLRYWVVKKMNSDPGWKQVCAMEFEYIYYVDDSTDRSNHFRRECSRRR